MLRQCAAMYLSKYVIYIPKYLCSYLLLTCLPALILLKIIKSTLVVVYSAQETQQGLGTYVWCKIFHHISGGGGVVHI